MSGARFAVVVKVAFVLVLSRATVPAGLTQGAAQDTEKLAVPVIEAIGSLNAAVIAVLRGTPDAPLTGATAVTVGTSDLEPVVKCHT